MQKEDENQPSSAKPVFDKDPEPVEWHLARNKEEFHILTLHPVEFARQLTLIQSEYFRAIHASELVDASWMKEEQKERASPHLLRLNRFETTVSNWLTMEIVFTENFDERVALVSRLVDIMVTLRQLNNFAGMFAINAAFESSSVYRLKSTFQVCKGVCHVTRPPHCKSCWYTPVLSPGSPTTKGVGEPWYILATICYLCSSCARCQ